MTAHVFYELAAGVGMPFASWTGPLKAAALWGGGGAFVVRAADRKPPEWDTAFAALNGFYLAASLAHLTGWPATRRACLPWLTECEGMSGRVIQPYNSVLYLSAGSALLALATENRRGRAWARLVPLLAVPALVRAQHLENARLQAAASQRPAWWNRRLAAG